MKHRFYYLFIAFFFLLYIGASLIRTPVAQAAGESYVFHYQKNKKADTEKALSSVGGGTSDDALQYTYVEATGGVYGNPGLKLKYQATGPTDVPDGSALNSDGHFFGGSGGDSSYNCNGYNINVILWAQPPFNLDHGLKFQTWITSATKNGSSVAASAVPRGCRPANAGLADVPTSHPSNITASAKDDVVPPDPSGGGGGPGSTTCDSGSFSLNWLLCPVFDGVQGVTQWIFNNLIQPLLMTNPICLDTSANPACNNTIYKVWSGFRIYGDIFLVIVLLVIVFGESIGGGMIDAYTAKKVLPRLLAAAVLINLSIYIMAFAIDITNVVGGGLGQLLTAPLGANGFYKIQPSGIQQAEIFGGAATAGLLAGAFVISTTGVVLLVLGLAITGIIAIVGVFITLIIRQAIIIALLLISPVAFALWCLPNTQQWFKKWWDTFFQMLLVYPMIIMAFAVADILGSITANNQGSGSSALNDVVAFMLLVIPLYMIPFMLRSSNRILGAVQGAVSNVGRQINAVSGRRVLGAAGQEAGRVFTKRRAGEGRFAGAPEGSFRDKLNRGIARTANLDNLGRSGLRPRNIRADLDAAVIANKNTARRKLAEESAAFQTFAGNDDMLEASMLMFNEGEPAARARLERGGITNRQQQDTAIAQIRAAQRQMGPQNLALTAAVANAGTGTGYAADGQGQGDMYDSIIRASDGDMQVAGSAYAEARGNAEKARRTDLLESFSSAMGHMDSIAASTTPSQRSLQIQRANEEGVMIAREIQGAGGVLGARGQAVRRFGTAIQQGQQDTLQAVAATRDGGDTTIREYDGASGVMHDVTVSADEAQRRWIQQMASDSALIDSSSGAAPEVQRMLADTAHNGELDLADLPTNLREILARPNEDGTYPVNERISMSQAYDRLQGQEAFRQMKKVYTERYQADAAAGGAAGAEPTPGAGPTI